MQPPIFRFNQQRETLVDEVVRRACESVREPQLLLNEAAFHEVRRQQASHGHDEVVSLGEWRALARSLGRMSDGESREKLEDLVRRYARDVAGNFDPRVYKFASRAVAPLIGMVMSPMQTVRHLGSAFDLRALDGRVVIEGPVAKIQRLAELGTIVFVPTHLSNLDSVVFGFALERAGLPPATYGAGKNLFSARPGRVAAFLRKLLGLDAGCVIRFGQPLDCFGNRVEEDGTSVDSRGHQVDALSYLTDADGHIGPDAARDAQYTRELGEAIVEAFHRDTVAMATHLVAACAFERLRDRLGKGGGDIFAMLRSHDDVLVSRAELADRVERLRDRAEALQAQGRIVLGPRLTRSSGREILDEALRAFSGYHTSPVLEPRGADLVLVDTRLIFYYQNRLAGHGLAADLVAPQRRARGVEASGPKSVRWGAGPIGGPRPG